MEQNMMSDYCRFASDLYSTSPTGPRTRLVDILEQSGGSLRADLLATRLSISLTYLQELITPLLSLGLLTYRHGIVEMTQKARIVEAA